jgi:hypothetical protein
VLQLLLLASLAVLPRLALAACTVRAW